MQSRRPVWRFGIFQIPAILLVLSLIGAILFLLLGLGKPSVSVVVAIDLSGSTYDPMEFNAPGTIVSQEFDAISAYLRLNDSLRIPNQVKVLGFGGNVEEITPGFQKDSMQIVSLIDQKRNDQDLFQKVDKNNTDVNRALEASILALNTTSSQCKEVLLVTDGNWGSIDNDILLNAKQNQIRINTILVSSIPSNPASQVFNATGGLDFSNLSANALTGIFTEKIFARFNNNWRWIIIWLGCAWIAFMWMLILPLDRWIFQRIFQLPMHLSGKLAISNALFWTALTPTIIWRLLSLPFISSC